MINQHTKLCYYKNHFIVFTNSTWVIADNITILLVVIKKTCPKRIQFKIIKVASRLLIKSVCFLKASFILLNFMSPQIVHQQKKKPNSNLKAWTKTVAPI